MFACAAGSVIAAKICKQDEYAWCVLVFVRTGQKSLIGCATGLPFRCLLYCTEWSWNDDFRISLGVYYGGRSGVTLCLPHQAARCSFSFAASTRDVRTDARLFAEKRVEFPILVLREAENCFMRESVLSCLGEKSWSSRKNVDVPWEFRTKLFRNLTKIQFNLIKNVTLKNKKKNSRSNRTWRCAGMQLQRIEQRRCCGPTDRPNTLC